MGLFFNFSMPKARQFNYKPWYYDERKERLEKMKAQAEAELALKKNGGTHHSNLEKGFLSDRRSKSKLHHTSLEKGSTIRFFIILIVLTGALYFFIPELFISFWKGN